MSITHALELWPSLVAQTLYVKRAARVKAAAGRQIEQAGDVLAAQLHASLPARQFWVCLGHRREQRLGIRMLRLVVDSGVGANSTTLPTYITAMRPCQPKNFANGQVVGDKQVGDAQIIFQTGHHV